MDTNSHEWALAFRGVWSRGHPGPLGRTAANKDSLQSFVSLRNTNVRIFVFPRQFSCERFGRGWYGADEQERCSHFLSSVNSVLSVVNKKRDLTTENPGRQSRNSTDSPEILQKETTDGLRSLRLCVSASLRFSPRASRSFDPGLTQRRRDAEAQRVLVVRTRFTNPPPVRFRRPPLFPSLNSVKSSQENKDSRHSVTNGKPSGHAGIVMHDDQEWRLSRSGTLWFNWVNTRDVRLVDSHRSDTMPCGGGSFLNRDSSLNNQTQEHYVQITVR